MWEFIKILIGIGIVLMVFSVLLGSLLMPVALPMLTVTKAYAQDTVVEETVMPPAAIHAGIEAVMPESDAKDTFIPTSTRDESFPVVVSENIVESIKTPVELESRGILTSDNGGFSSDLWQGVSRERAEVLLSRVRQQGLKSNSSLRLLQRVLLTEATPPEGEFSTNWLATRVRTLQATGAADAAHELLVGVTEPDLQVNDLAQAWVNDQLLTGGTERACQFVKSHIMNTDASYWRQAILVCQALSGDSDRLQLSMKLVTSAEKAADPLLYNLLEAALNKRPSPRLSPTDVFNPLHVSIYQGYPMLINPEVMVRLPDVSLRRITLTNSLNISIRLQAAEKLVNDFGDRADVDILTKMYDEIEFSSEVLESPLKFVQQEQDGSKARALLWQAAGAAKLPSGKALVLKVLWQKAEKDLLSDLPGSLAPSLRGVQPEGNLAWFSPYVIKTALRSGNLPVAKSWWQVLSGNRSLSRDLTIERTDLAVAFAMLASSLERQVLDQWWTTQMLNTTANRLKTTRILSLLEALDLDVPNDIWIGIHHEFNDAHINRGEGPGPIWLRMVGNSLEKGHIGEAVLMLLEPVMYTHPVNMSPQGIANIVAGLKYLGLNEDATSLALEAILQGETKAF